MFNTHLVMSKTDVKITVATLLNNIDFFPPV